jgi:hypothetical protein
MKGMLATLLVGIAIAPGVCSSASPMSPASGSDAVLSIRSAPESELRLQYRKEEPGKTDELVSLGIAADYHYIIAAGEARIYDYKLRRIFSVRPANSFVNDSLYAEVWYRAMELKN